MNHKKYLIPFILAVLIAFFIFLYWNIQPFILKTEVQKGFWINIYGKVSPDVSAANQTPPQYARIYSYLYDYDFESLCSKSGTTLRGIAKIKWDNSSNGEYSISIELPVSMNIYVATDCGDCNRKKVYIDSKENEKNVDILWGKTSCSNDVVVSDNYFDEKTYLERLISGFQIPLNEISDKNQIDNIQKDKTASDELLQNAREEEKRNLTNAYIKVLQSEILFKKANYDIELYKLGKCITEFQDIISKYNNYLCYIPDYNAVEVFNESNKTYFSYNLVDYYSIRGIMENNNIEQLKNNIYWMNNGKTDMMSYVYECNSALKTLENSFDFQSNYCKQKEISILALNSSILFIILGVGFIIGYLLGKRWKGE